MKEEIAGEATRGVVHGHDGSMEVVASDKANQAIPQVVTGQKNEDREDQNDATGSDGAEQRLGDGTRDREIGLPDVEHRGPLCRRGSRAGLAFRRGQARSDQPRHRPVALPERLPLLPDGRLVVRQAAGQQGSLATDHQADAADDPESEKDHHDHGRDLGQPQTLQQGTGRGEDEGEQRSQHERHDEFAAEVEGRDQHRAAVEGRKRRARGRGVVECRGQGVIQEREGRRVLEIPSVHG